MKLDQKVAIVTGASKGIGASIAEHLAEAGSAVVVNYARSAADADAVVARIRAKGGKAVAIGADVSKPEESARLVAATVKEFGRLDVLVNNAGVYEFAPLGSLTEEHFDRQFGLNVRGLVFATQAAVAHMGEGASIINVGSIVSLTPPANGSVYSATKGAVDTLTKSWAAELGPRKIRVNVIAPGYVETPGTETMDAEKQIAGYMLSRTPLGRTGQPNDIAKVATFLASDDSAWVTGTVLPAGGGLTV